MPLRIFAVLLLPLFALACAATLYLTGHAMRNDLLHADALYLPTLFDDLMRHGGHLWDWYLTPAPYFFPDFLTFWLAYLIGPNSFVQIIVHAVLQGILLLAGAVALARLLGARAAVPCAAFGVVALVALSVTAQPPFELLLSSASHYGAFVGAVFLVAAWLRFAQTGSRAALWFACALAFLITLSDSLFLLQAALPLAVTFGARTLLEPAYLAGRRRRRLLPWAVLAAAILGQMSYKVLVKNRTRYGAHLDVHHIPVNLHDMKTLLSQTWSTVPVFVVCWVVFFAFALACAARLAARREAPFGVPRPLAWVTTFWLLSTAGTLAVFILVDNIPVSARYFIAFACWPVLLAPPVLAHALGKWAAPAALAGALACCGALGVSAAEHLRRHAPDTVYYSDDVACMDRTLAPLGLQRGITDYWFAKTFQRFSRTGIILAQYTDLLEENRWITSKRYFAPAYDFALLRMAPGATDDPMATRLEAINGKPSSEAHCGDFVLLIYGQGKMRVR